MNFFLRKSTNKRRLLIKTGRVNQKIVIGNNLLDSFIDEVNSRNFSKIVLLVDKYVSEIYGDMIKKMAKQLNINGIIYVSPSEMSKSINKISIFAEQCYEHGLNRNGCIIGMGGGITGDAAGFLSSIYMRGVSFVFLPTTAMAQGDSVIGKVGVAYKDIKNILGSFYSPELTYCDSQFINSQDIEGILVGVSEIIKIGLIASPKLINYLENQDSKTEIDIRKVNWEYLFYETLKIKGKLVELDPYDTKGIQKGLSYGHTVANALESASNFKLRHGEAVTLGMRIAAEVSNKLGLLSAKNLIRQNNLLDSYGLINKIPFLVDTDELIMKLKKDKLSTNGKVDLVLLESIGRYRVVNNINDNIVAKAIEKYR